MNSDEAAVMLDTLADIKTLSEGQSWWCQVVVCLLGMYAGGWSFYQVWIVSRGTRVLGLLFGLFFLGGASDCSATSMVGQWSYQWTAGNSTPLKFLPGGTGEATLWGTTFTWSESQDKVTLNGTGGWELHAVLVTIPYLDSDFERMWGYAISDHDNDPGTPSVPMNVVLLRATVSEAGGIFCYSTLSEFGYPLILGQDEVAFDTNGAAFWFEISLGTAVGFQTPNANRKYHIDDGCQAGGGAPPYEPPPSGPQPPNPSGKQNVFKSKTDVDGNQVDDTDEFPCLEEDESKMTGDNDGDGVSNMMELLEGTNPCDATSKPGAGVLFEAGVDLDGNQIDDGDEYPCVNNLVTNEGRTSTDDTDGDGFTDGYEIQNGSDPCDPLIHPPYPGAPKSTQQVDVTGFEDGIVSVGNVDIVDLTYTDNVDLGEANIDIMPAINKTMPIIPQTGFDWGYTFDVFGTSVTHNLNPAMHPLIVQHRSTVRSFLAFVISMFFVLAIKSLLLPRS